MKYLKFLFIGLFTLMLGDTNGQDQLILSADSLYNLGNAAYSNKQYDQAILYYEKAKLLDPFSEDISVNLQLANEQLSTDIIELDPFFLATWWKSLNGLLLPGGWKIISILVLFGIVIGFYFHFFKNKPEGRSLFYVILGVLVTLFIITIVAGQGRANQIFNSPYVIVFGDDQALFLGPDLVSEEVKQITGGNKLKILDEDGEWYKVSAMDSEQGWIKKENVKLIKF